MKVSLFVLVVFASILCTSCSSKLIGTWKVQKYERVTPGEQETTLQNIGTITFNTDNTGEKELDYGILGIEQSDVTPFTWSSTEDYVIIESDNSELAKTWIYIKNKGKFQKWKSTDGKYKVQTLELIKE